MDFILIFCPFLLSAVGGGGE
ncbi:hypothetical protein CCACVL1_10969, partial [Corchorus capsularis]